MGSGYAHRVEWKQRVAVTLLSVGIVGTAAGSAAAAPAEDPLRRPVLEQHLRQLAQAQHDGVVARVETETGTWRSAAGYVVGRRKAAPGNRFDIASTTKTFVAATVLQLVGDRRLKLADTVERHLRGQLRDGRRITVRQLLNHTSGLAPDLSLDRPPGDQPPLVSRPGTVYRYSNLEYDLLALIIERVTGRPVERVVRDRIFRPLGLVHSSYDRAGWRAHGEPMWLGLPDEPDGDAGGAGGIVSTTAELARFFHALLGGELLERSLLQEMMRTVPTNEGARAGLGMFRWELPCGSAWGHAGDQPSYSNHVATSPDGSTVVVVAQNTTGWMSAKATAEAMFCTVS